MLVTGALPLIGFALLAMVWWAMSELAEEWSGKKALILIACLGLIPWINQTTAGLAIVTIPVYGAAILWFHSHEWREPSHALGDAPKRLSPIGVLCHWGGPFLAGGIIALASLPWYLKVLPGSGVLNYPGPIAYLTHSADSAWLQLILALTLGIYVIRKAKEPWLRSMGVLLILFGLLVPWLSTDETLINISYRSRYLMAIPVYTVLSWAVFTQWWPRIPANAKNMALMALVAAAGLMAIGFVSQFHRQAEYSRMVSTDTEIALAMIPDDGLAVINNSFTLALWVAALNEVEAPHTWTWSPPPTWVETDRHVRCVLGWRSECSPQTSVHALNAGYILLERRFPFYNLRAPGVYGAPDYDDPWGNLPDVPWLSLMFEQGTTQLWRIE